MTWLCALLGHKFKLETSFIPAGPGYHRTAVKEVEHVWCVRCGARNGEAG